MRISKISFNLSRRIMPAITAAAMLVPAKIAKEPVHTVPSIANYISVLAKKASEIDSTVVNGLKIVSDTNFKGGVVHRFDDNSVQILKNRILRDETFIKYVSPIENTNNVYIEDFGKFMADRPDKNIKRRPHLGLDIFVTPFAKKPKSPVPVTAPLDGVVVAYKRARKDDNVISNSVTMLGVDGRKYAFDHLARHNDYDTHIPLPKPGTILKAGDKIGYVGCTGETVMWHLHLIVMTDEMLQKQLKSRYWQNLSKISGYCPLRGQVNPLDYKQAGPIANRLNEYRYHKY